MCDLGVVLWPPCPRESPSRGPRVSTKSGIEPQEPRRASEGEKGGRARSRLRSCALPAGGVRMRGEDGDVREGATPLLFLGQNLLRAQTKMEDGLLSLKWNNHKSTFFHILSEVRGKHTYTDATLACEGKFYPVHKLVMSTCSDYFAEIFEKTPCKNPVVVLKDIKKSDLDALLDYMYIGEVDVRQSELAGLIKAAECLRIKGLAVPDEDPTKAQKKGPINVPERREDSPPAKRKRRDSGGERGRAPTPPAPRGASQSSSSSSSHPAPSSSVPSQAPPQLSSVPESHVPSQSMPPPASVSQELRHTDGLRGRQDSQLGSVRPPPDPSSLRSPPGGGGGGQDHSHPSSASPRSDSSLLPVQMIKVEVDDGSDPPGPPGSKDPHPEREEGGSEMDGDEEASNDFSDYQSHPGEIEKEEHDQMDYGADQIPGPSGLQGGPPMLGWGEEGEAGFPHNLFGGDDPTAQQAGLQGVAAMVDECRLQLPAFVSRLGLPGAPSAVPLASPLAPPPPLVPPALDGGGGVGGGGGERGGGGPGAGMSVGSEVGEDAGARRHVCGVCGRGFRLANDLRRHLRIHTGEKPFCCPHCPYRASQKQSVNRHVRTVHADLMLLEVSALAAAAAAAASAPPAAPAHHSLVGRGEGGSGGTHPR
ncbi:longitudinals lacking protein, isoforms A/B/D/L-like isoform X3 [Penaeus monodon]|uniref:longitudinals lacking protein, isoforms A/B/D/L-like isoform X3 n=1 Tax=Penaeus monodon TaxID=6687 RepID=UPI0018A7D08E|nr:longitudinals lacking protein, isoforms A/B/D/L-like isoform X3 [Penaeus monodon]